MEYTRALIEARNGKAILFVGAGFSRGATSLDDTELPTGKILALQLCKEAGVPQTDDLKMATSRYLKKKNSDELIERLRTIFTVKSVTETQKGIACIPWRSMYSTNYDNVLERAAAEKGKKITPLTLNCLPREHRQSAHTVLHLNGFIDALNNEALDTSFKLTNTSYLTEQFRNSIWSEVFIRDIQTAHSVFFVGYSMYDLDIQEILYADENLHKKVFFIQPDNLTAEDIEFSELNDFGTIKPIGVSQFLKDVEGVDPLAITDEKALILTGFEEVFAAKVQTTKTRDDDVFGFLLRGEVNKNMVLDKVFSKVRDDYIFERDAETDLTDAIERSENFVVYGDMANGKTTLLRIMTAHFLLKGVRVFWIKDEAYENFEEVENIINLNIPIVLVFENYTRKMKLVSHANIKRKLSTKLLLSARTLDHEGHEEALYFSQVRLDLKKTTELNINKLSKADLAKVSGYFERYGLWGEKVPMHPEAKLQYLKRECNSELHAALLGVISSPQIQQKFITLFAEIQHSANYSKAIIAAFTLNILNYTEPTMHMLAAMTDDASIFSPHFKSNQVAKQLFNTARGVVTPKSSVLAEYALKNFPNTSLLIESLILICRNTRKKAEASTLYWDIYRELASFRNIQKMLPDVGMRESLIAFYEGLRSIDIERQNPHFWLQYAIARLTYPDANNLQHAKRYLETALSLAKKRNGYTTSDFETQYARYYLEHALNVAMGQTERFENFKKAHEMLSKITKNEKYKREAYRPTRLYEPFFKKDRSIFSDSQKSYLLSACSEILENIKRLPPRMAEDKTVLASRDGLEHVIRNLSE